ncbi:MAG: zinc ABC transporter substrate-binding protein [Solirubrobacteraceae bacterium]
MTKFNAVRFPRFALIVIAALVLLAAVIASGCGASGESASASEIAERKVKVTTTTNFITDTVRQIGGDRVEVSGLMGPGVDPHLYKASAGDVKTLREADVIIYGGLQLEGKMADLLDELEERQTTVAITKDIPRESLLEPPAQVAEQYDPHIWFDVTNWMFAAKTTAAALKEKDPASAELYDANLRKYLAELEAADAYVKQRIEEIPQDKRVLITSHDAFEYFGRRYEMDVDAIQGISTATEATTKDVQRVASLVADRGVKAVFIESSVPRQTIDAVLAAARKKGADAKIGGELFTDAAGDEGTPEGTYVGMVRANADKIAEGLK